MQSARIARRFCQVGDVRTAYLEAGAGEATVVAIHGVPTSSELFEPLLPALDTFRVIAPDLLGQGETETPPGPLGYPQYIAHLDAFLEAVAPPRFDLVVHDLGGLLGLDWAGRHPERVRRLVVLSTTVTARARWGALWAASYALALAGGAPAVRRLIVWLAKRRGAIPHELSERWARPWTRRRVLRGLDHMAAGRLRAVAARLAALEVPALLVWGEQDELFPPRYAEPFLEMFPGAELRLVPGAGHWSMLDAPDVVGQCIRGFLERG